MHLTLPSITAPPSPSASDERLMEPQNDIVGDREGESVARGGEDEEISVPQGEWIDNYVDKLPI